MSDEQYFLNWQNHTNYMLNAVKNLYVKNAYHDLTLSCEGKLLQCHKVIVAPCSTFIKKIIDAHEHLTVGLVIVLPVGYETMKNILHFMYAGDVAIPEHTLDSFLKASELLEISGLKDLPEEPEKMTSSDEEADVPCEKASSEKNVVADVSPAKIRERKRRKTVADISNSQVDEKQNCLEEQHNSIKESRSKESPENLRLDESKNITIEEVRDILKDHSYLNPGTNLYFQCPICEKKYNTKYRLTEHLKFHLGQTVCKFCKKIYSKPYGLKRHSLRGCPERKAYMKKGKM